MSRQQVYQWPVLFRTQAQEMRGRGKSYRQIASAIAARNGVARLSHQTVRNWVKPA